MPIRTLQSGRARFAASFLAVVGAAALLGLASRPAHAQEDGVKRKTAVEDARYAELVRDVITRHVRPAAEGFALTAELLDADLTALCDAPSDTALATARRSFEATARGYGGLFPVRFGPILRDNRQERLAFWPDPRGLGLKQVQKILAATDETATRPDTLAKKSVGVQGLTALEFLLYGTGSQALLDGTEAGAFRCRYGAAIGANVKAIADALSSDWAEDGMGAAQFEQPGPANLLFQTHKEAASKIINTVAASLETIADDMIDAPFGESPDTAKPKLAVFWRSGQSVPAVVSALEATQHLIEVGNVAGLLEEEEIWLGNSILFEARNAAATFAKIDRPIEDAVADNDSRKIAVYVLVAVHSLKRSIGRELTAAIGLDQGFNANDGD
jgi:predicted lipoprotein